MVGFIESLGDVIYVTSLLEKSPAVARRELKGAGFSPEKLRSLVEKLDAYAQSGGDPDNKEKAAILAEYIENDLL